LQYLDQTWGGSDDAIAVCMKLSQCYQKLGNPDMELHYILISLAFGVPAAEQCCRLGNYFYLKENWNAGIFWFNLAAQMKYPNNSWLLINQHFYTWVPHQHLAICYGKLGMLQQAYHHNEIARSYLPDDPALLLNKQILERHLQPDGKGAP
jgi:tetratricopeptide (TPR) repeat protein